MSVAKLPLLRVAFATEIPLKSQGSMILSRMLGYLRQHVRFASKAVIAVSRRLHGTVRYSLIWKVVAQIVVCSGVWIRSRGKRKPPLTRWCLRKAEREHQSFALQKERYFLPFIEERNLNLLKDKRSGFLAWHNEFRPSPPVDTQSLHLLAGLILISMVGGTCDLLSSFC